jgi:hypothetical protein
MTSDAAASADGDPERVCTLQRNHTVLERAIETETHRPLPDAIFVSEMKRRKLRIKDALRQYQQSQSAENR